MRNKHYYVEDITPWSSDNGETGFILWYRIGGLKRGKLDYEREETIVKLRKYSWMIGFEKAMEDYRRVFGA